MTEITWLRKGWRNEEGAINLNGNAGLDQTSFYIQSSQRDSSAKPINRHEYCDNLIQSDSDIKKQGFDDNVIRENHLLIA